MGKLIKVAGGIFDTKHAVADGRREIMVTHAALCGADRNALQRLYDSKTTDDMMDILDEINLSVEVSNSIACAIHERCMQRFDFDLNVILVDMEGNYLNDNMKSVTYAYPSDWYTLDSLSRVQCLNNLYSEGRCASYSVLTFEENKLVCLTTFIYASKSKKVNQLVIFKEVSNSLYELLSKENISYEWKGFVYAYDEKERQYTNHDAYCTAIGGTTVGGTTEGGYVITASPMKGVAYMGFCVDGEAEKENDTMLSYWGVATTQFAHDQSPFYSFLPKP
jgi:hypothetical protein